VALVVLRSESDATAEDILEFLSGRVASWQMPDIIEFVAELPKTGVGKIDKRRLRDEFVPELLARIDSPPSP
jgi:fatty-acyl-CoA synthase